MNDVLPGMMAQGGEAVVTGCTWQCGAGVLRLRLRFYCRAREQLLPNLHMLSVVRPAALQKRPLDDVFSPLLINILVQ